MGFFPPLSQRLYDYSLLTLGTVDDSQDFLISPHANDIIPSEGESQNKFISDFQEQNNHTFKESRVNNVGKIFMKNVLGKRKLG